jgi:hypothetical protein
LSVDRVLPGLHASTPQPLSFDSSIASRAFLLEREAGNLLVYSSALAPRRGAGSWARCSIG